MPGSKLPEALPHYVSSKTTTPFHHLRLRPRVVEYNDDEDIEPMDLSKMDEDPISYFLTPAPPIHDDLYNNQEDAMDFEMDFDAGIEDVKHPPPIIRSVSPSSLHEGLSLPPVPRPPTPPKSPGTPDSSASDQPLTPDDHEDYMRFASLKGRSLTFPIRLADLTVSSKKRPKHYRSSGSGGSSYLSPETFNSHSPDFDFGPRHYPQTPYGTFSGGLGSSHHRGRTLKTKTAMMPLRRSPHSWREPSPDVWSIEEETEMQDAIDSERGGNPIVGVGTEQEQGEDTTTTGRTTRSMATRAIEIPAAKPKKRVRFVLPIIE